MKNKGVLGILGLIAFIIVLIGALNWGLVGAFNLNLVALILGYGTAANVVYIIVGVAALYKIVMMCMKKGMKKE
ncbi:MAG: DUF378 domain-containing protein [Patescibacteria group bacterium]|nr:DUF378 domain-containing protein [Patescibacteria group bacterium]